MNDIPDKTYIGLYGGRWGKCSNLDNFKVIGQNLIHDPTANMQMVNKRLS